MSIVTEFRKLEPEEIPEYLDYITLQHKVGSHGICGIQEMIFTWGFMVDIKDDPITIDAHRYCYPKTPENLALIVELMLGGWPEGEHPPGPWIKYKGNRMPEFTNPNHKKEE